MKPNITRRSFLEKGAFTASLITIVPRHVVAASGQTPPSERVRVAAIGSAGRATDNINGLAWAGAEIVGLCDVDTRRVGKMREKFKDARFFTDYRKMLDELDKQIDGVTIGVPDHWHATMAIEALKRGKHVQCEKPLAQTFGEVDAMVKVARETKLVNQAMNQGHAYDSIRTFREWVEAGLIGNVREAHFWAPASYSHMDRLHELKPDIPVPAELDWEMWQGPAKPHRPYSPLYLPGAWRFWRDYGTSTLGDWSCHLLDPIFWTLNLGLPTSVRVDDIGNWDPDKHGATFPKGDRFTMEFAAQDGRPPVKLVWYDGHRYRDVPRPAGIDVEDFTPTKKEYRNGDEGSVVYGDKGVIVYGSHGAKNPRILPDSRFEDLKRDGGLPAERYPRVKNSSPYHEWVGAVKGENKIGSDFAYAGNITQAALMTLAALYDPGKTLHWDSTKREFKNSSRANARLRVPRLTGYGS